MTSVGEKYKLRTILCTKSNFCFGIQYNFCTQHVLNLHFTELVIQWIICCHIMGQLMQEWALLKKIYLYLKYYKSDMRNFLVRWTTGYLMFPWERPIYVTTTNFDHVSLTFKKDCPSFAHLSKNILLILSLFDWRLNIHPVVVGAKPEASVVVSAVVVNEGSTSGCCFFVIWVVRFSRYGYKINYTFDQKWT